MTQIALLCLTLAAAVRAESPAVVKMLGLFEQFRDPGKPHVGFELTEAEINEYLRYALVKVPRPGLQSMQIKVFPKNYLSTFTTIDFDAVEKWKPGTVPTLLRPVLSGKKSVWLDVRFTALNGMGSFTVEKAYFGDLRLPAVMVEKAIGVLAARQPEKYDTSKPVPLPFGFKTIWTGRKLVAGEK